MSDSTSGIGGLFGGVIQQMEQTVEKDIGQMFSGSSSGTSGPSLFGGGAIGDSMGNFNLGALFGANGNGLAGELFGSILGNQFGILGGIFANNSNPSSQGNGYAVAPPPPHTATPATGGVPYGTCNGSGNTGSTGSTGGSNWTPAYTQYCQQEQSSLESVMANFNKLAPNGKLSQESLLVAAYDPSNPDLQKAAQFLTNDPGLMADMFRNGDMSMSELKKMYDVLAANVSQMTGQSGGSGISSTMTTGSTTTATGGSTTTGGTSTTTTTSDQDYSNLIADLENQINNLAKKTTTTTSGGGTTTSSGGIPDSLSKLDDQVGGYQADIQKQMGILSDPRSTDAQRQAAQTQIQLDTMRMQQDLDAIKQLFDMLSNMEKSFSDICMNAISNMR